MLKRELLTKHPIISYLWRRIRRLEVMTYVWVSLELIQNVINTPCTIMARTIQNQVNFNLIKSEMNMVSTNIDMNRVMLETSEK
jgi:hypothetical protein